MLGAAYELAVVGHERLEIGAKAQGRDVLVPPGFDTPVALPANTTYVGPVTHAESGLRRDGLLPSDLDMITRPGDPLVLLSLSTTLQRQTQALPAMLAAVGSLPVRVLLTLGGVVPIEAVVAPPNVTVRDFVPHDMVLPHMAAVICHGGLSTITAALAASVPLVCIPQGRDQPNNAARVEACGVGRAIAPEAPRGGDRNRSRRCSARRRCSPRDSPFGGRDRGTRRRRGGDSRGRTTRAFDGR